MPINNYTGKEETRKKIVLEVQTVTCWDFDFDYTGAMLPKISLPNTFLNKKAKVTVELIE